MGQRSAKVSQGQPTPANPCPQSSSSWPPPRPARPAACRARVGRWCRAMPDSSTWVSSTTRSVWLIGQCGADPSQCCSRSAATAASISSRFCPKVMVLVWVNCALSTHQSLLQKRRCFAHAHGAVLRRGHKTLHARVVGVDGRRAEGAKPTQPTGPVDTLTAGIALSCHLTLDTRHTAHGTRASSAAYQA